MNINKITCTTKKLELGGHGSIVEIDESIYAKVKHLKRKNLGRERVWVLGLVVRKRAEIEETPKCYTESVDNREAETLISIVYEKCKSTIVIYLDCWALYNKLCSFKDFKHKTVKS
ncbi:unnamed protein product [Brachionus calyciflorus]|uniref:ISXO2-like transposase domain-containing protein n=1 Tax=Brachionus calyciflorus TaxID=104777 RepID=A0A814RAY4_9BILA|nr:unnamed protein product [Brachionus calyciflorus]